MIDSEKTRREQLRWIMILALGNARPIGAHETVLHATARAIYPDTTALEVRRALDYLEERDLVKITKDPAGPWSARLTRYGIDVQEYTIACEPGIARPDKYWV